MASDCEAEVTSCVKAIRAFRESPNLQSSEHPGTVTVGNLRFIDVTRGVSESRFRPDWDTDVRLDVVVRGIATPLEQWRIVPGAAPSDATAMSLLIRALIFHLRISELYDAIAKRGDIDVVCSNRAVLPDDSAHRVSFTCGSDFSTSVYVVLNENWRSILLEKENRLRDTDGLGYLTEEGHHKGGDALAEKSEESSVFSVGSCGALPTPPLKLGKGAVGSFGTSPHVGQQGSVVGSFVLPATVATNSSPAMTFTTPKLGVEPEEMTSLIPITSCVETSLASPRTSVPLQSDLCRHSSDAQPVVAEAQAHRNRVPFGVGSSTNDLDEYSSSSPPTGDHAEFPAPAEPGSEDAAHRAALIDFLSAVQEFAPKVKNVSSVLVSEAARFVLESS